jgi:hypothetical protein
MTAAAAAAAAAADAADAADGGSVNETGDFSTGSSLLSSSQFVSAEKYDDENSSGSCKAVAGSRTSADAVRGHNRAAIGDNAIASGRSSSGAFSKSVDLALVNPFWVLDSIVNYHVTDMAEAVKTYSVPAATV